jgi:acyl-CoA dehydrogenase
VSSTFSAAEAGILAAGFPEALRGHGQEHACCRCSPSRQMIWGGSTGVVAGVSSHGIALPPIVNLGDGAQKQRWVAPRAAR